MFDFSGLNNNCVINGVTEIERAKGKALSFDGNDYLDYGNSGSLNIANAITMKKRLKK